ncbi:HPr kinase/phosphatase C-terminal domain-containing protein [Actibacterium sp. MT2.3-13A]|uniref:HPr kinase/phosphorylase n=1 Tax=Actibacterium sp. MT2.3-13A TaxID=2828332 RepID=UPI001BA9D1D1|nr:HPr kinase/phosphatase C-terminal domain-containing protein [Actibacterium sp. MT2.3-13A]
MTGPSILHASCVALSGRGVLILGASGAGKSALALELMARGAALVADDRTCLRAGPGGLVASAPASIAGLIEARGVGILRADAVPQAEVVLAVDLDRVEAERLPPPREIRLLDRKVSLLHKVENAHFPAAILQYLKRGRSA